MSDQDEKPSAWDSPAHPAPLPVKKTFTPRPLPTAVRVIDVDMPFGSMVLFMVKWAIAAIPAIVILIMLWTIIGTFFKEMVTVVG